MAARTPPVRRADLIFGAIMVVATILFVVVLPLLSAPLGSLVSAVTDAEFWIVPSASGAVTRIVIGRVVPLASCARVQVTTWPV